MDFVLDENILNLLNYYAVLSLKNPSPLIRTSGLKVFNEILYTNFIPIKELISKIFNLKK